MKKIIILFLPFLIILQPAFANSVTVTDFFGREVVLDKPAKRIIALAPHIVENVFSAGAGDLLVGTVAYSDYPEQAKNILRVGNIQGFSLEAIIALKPDLVIAWHSGHTKDITRQLTDLGIPVYLDEPRKLEDVARAIRDIGLLSDRQQQSEQSAIAFLQQLKSLREQYSYRPVVSMLYQVWNKPLQTLNDKHIISDVMRLCGGKNSFGDAVVLAPQISVESVLERNPDAIVASGMGQERPEWLDAWKQWPSLTAVKNNHLFFIHPDIIQRHTVRILQGAKQLCEQLESVRRS